MKLFYCIMGRSDIILLPGKGQKTLLNLRVIVYNSLSL